jgi:hypothetical protein
MQLTSLPQVPLSLSSLRGGLVATNPNPAEGEERRGEERSWRKTMMETTNKTTED